MNKLKIVGLSNGVHVFESLGNGTLGECKKSNIANEVCQALYTYMEMNDIDHIRFTHTKDNKSFVLKIEELSQND